MTQAEALLPGAEIIVAPAGIRRIIELDAEPGGLLAGAAANFRRVLADTCGEDQRVQAAEAGGKRSQLPADPVDE